jgi:hypothetical protein
VVDIGSLSDVQLLAVVAVLPIFLVEIVKLFLPAMEGIFFVLALILLFDFGEIGLDVEKRS